MKKLENEVDCAIRLEDFVEGNDIVVGQHTQILDFVLQAEVFRQLARKLVLAEGLDGVALAIHPVGAFVNLKHSNNYYSRISLSQPFFGFVEFVEAALIELGPEPMVPLQ